MIFEIKRDKLFKIALYISLLGTISLLSTGCMSAPRAFGFDTTSNKEQDAAFLSGDYKKAAELAVDDKDLDTSLDNENLLPTLKAGNAYLFGAKYPKSVKYLDEAERIIKYQREQILLGSAADYIQKLTVNDAAMEYYATMYDSIMLNTYKSIDYMAQHKFDDARIELNRALDRQRRAKEIYAELIEKQREAIRDEESSDGIGEIIKKTLNSSETQDAINNHYSNLKEFSVYPEFVNPFTVYLAGIFFCIQGDYQKSLDLLKEASSMIPNNGVVLDDFKRADAALSGKKIDEDYVWIVFENGFAPVKEEFLIEIPMFLISGDVKYVGLALPEYKPRPSSLKSISVKGRNSKTFNTEIVADMDRVYLTEFKYKYNDIITRAIFSTLLKSYEQYLAQQTNGYLGLATSILSKMTTRVDTRSWTTLPKNFQVTRMLIPKDRNLQLQIGDITKNIQLEKNAKNAIVYVRAPDSISEPSISVINFKK